MINIYSTLFKKNKFLYFSCEDFIYDKIGVLFIFRIIIGHADRFTIGIFWSEVSFSVTNAPMCVFNSPNERY